MSHRYFISMGVKLQQLTLLGWNLVLGVFRHRWLRMWAQIQKFEMSDAIWRTKIQKAKSYAAKVSLWHNFCWVADYESNLGFLKSIWRIQDGGRQFKKLYHYAEILYLNVFCVADYELDLWFSYFVIGDPFQLLKSKIIIRFGWNAICVNLCARWLRIHRKICIDHLQKGGIFTYQFWSALNNSYFSFATLDSLSWISIIWKQIRNQQLQKTKNLDQPFWISKTRWIHNKRHQKHPYNKLYQTWIFKNKISAIFSFENLRALS